MAVRGAALVAEDDIPIRTLIERLLQREGFDVEAVPDGRWAIEQITKRDFDVLVVDLMMPGASGYSILNFLEKNKPEMLKRVIVITAAHGTIVKSLDRFGIHSTIKKPFDLDQFRAAVVEAAGTAATLDGAPVVANVVLETGSCPSAEHLWREVGRTSTEVLDLVNEKCEKCGSTRTLYIAHPHRPEGGGAT